LEYQDALHRDHRWRLPPGVSKRVNVRDSAVPLDVCAAQPPVANFPGKPV
jgi:hypothetical protein